jgi:hypothetical protein
LSDDYLIKKILETKSAYEAVAMVAQERMLWKSVAKLTDVSCELRGEKIIKRREAREKRKELKVSKGGKNGCLLVCLCKCGVLFRSVCTVWRASSCLILCLLANQSLVFGVRIL